MAVWDGILLAAAANQAGSTDGDAMRQAMADGLDIDPEDDPFGFEGYQFGENGQNIYGSSVIVQYMGGELKTVYPLESVTAEVVYPAVGWNER